MEAALALPDATRSQEVHTLLEQSVASQALRPFSDSLTAAPPSPAGANSSSDGAQPQAAANGAAVPAPAKPLRSEMLFREAQRSLLLRHYEELLAEALVLGDRPRFLRWLELYTHLLATHRMLYLAINSDLSALLIYRVFQK